MRIFFTSAFLIWSLLSTLTVLWRNLRSWRGQTHEIYVSSLTFFYRLEDWRALMQTASCMLCDMQIISSTGDLFDMLLPMLSIYQEYVRNHHYSLQVSTKLKLVIFLYSSTTFRLLLQAPVDFNDSYCLLVGLSFADVSWMQTATRFPSPLEIVRGKTSLQWKDSWILSNGSNAQGG